jgi:glycosyltransferase involved in cell wall biosynthesis
MGQLEYTYNRRRTGFKCVDCAYDSQLESNMIVHCKTRQHGVVGPSVAIDAYIESQKAEGPKSVIITLGYLCWNTRAISVEGVLALKEEADRLRSMGNIPFICVIDNGSTDGTYDAILAAFGGQLPPEVFLSRLPENRGISHARNHIIRFALACGSKYTLFMDGDIEVVPLSTYTMMRYLECHARVGVIGAYSSNCSEHRNFCAKVLTEIPESRIHVDIRVAWTQYGLFRTALFEKGVEFDESGPFGQPGWGYEDDDLHYQIVRAGYENRYFGGMCYLHRALHSSWGSLKRDGVDLEKMFTARKDYLLQKWRKLGADAGILKLVEAQRLPRA